jgi:hypothetical protein
MKYDLVSVSIIASRCSSPTSGLIGYRAVRPSVREEFSTGYTTHIEGIFDYKILRCYLSQGKEHMYERKHATP